MALPGQLQALLADLYDTPFEHHVHDFLITDPQRAAALQSIGKIQTVEAGEFLVMVLRQESGPLREAAYAALTQMDNADVLPILRQHHEIETNPQVRDTLGELLRRH